MNDRSAPVVWKEFRSDPVGFYERQPELLRRLANFRSVRPEVTGYVLALLQRGELSILELRNYGRIKDDRIRNWVSDQASNATDREIRALCKQMSGPTPQKADWLTLRNGRPPDDGPAVFRTEVDLQTIDRDLRRLRKQHGVELPKYKKDFEFLRIADPSSWFAGTVHTPSGDVILWVRAEDEDVVEIALQPKPDAGSTTRFVT